MASVKRKAPERYIIDKKALEIEKDEQKNGLRDFDLRQIPEAPLALNPCVSTIRSVLREGIWSYAKVGVVGSRHETNHVNLTMQLDGWAIFPNSYREMRMGEKVSTFYDIFYKQIKGSVVVYPVVYAVPVAPPEEQGTAVSYKEAHDFLKRHLPADAEVMIDHANPEHVWWINLETSLGKASKWMYCFSEPSEDLLQMTNPRYIKAEITFRNFKIHHGQS
jgi:hypothetical protein